jgi:hypothetical protein
VERSCEHDNEPAGLIKCKISVAGPLASSQQELSARESDC